MAISTRMTQILGIEHPIMMGGMQHIATAYLCAAVSAAGGLGITSASLYSGVDAYRTALRQIREMTDKPFAVNISMVPSSEINEDIFRFIRIAGEEGATAIETSGKDPTSLVSVIHSHGMKHIHKAPSVKHAVKAQDSGVDIVSVTGCEAGGHPGPDMVPAQLLVNKAVRQCSIPVLYGGGVANGRALAAALAVGAEGVVVGTGFSACKESVLSPAHKKWIVAHSERDTTLCQTAIRNPIRCARNKDAERCLALEAEPGCTFETLRPIISGSVSKAAYTDGDVDRGIFVIGQSIGLIDEIRTAKEMIDSIIFEACEAIGKMMSQITVK